MRGPHSKADTHAVALLVLNILKETVSLAQSQMVCVMYRQRLIISSMVRVVVIKRMHGAYITRSGSSHFVSS